MKTPSSTFVHISYEGMEYGVSIKYRRAGKHLVVFLHGFGCAKECFDEVFEQSGFKEYSLLTFDWLGHGESDKPQQFSYHMEDQAAIALQVLAQFPHEELTIVAHSMGGAIGLIMAPHLPNLLHFVDVEGNLVSEDAGIVSRRTATQSEQDFVERGYDDFLDLLMQAKRSDFSAWAKWYGESDKVALHRSARSLVDWSDSGKLLPILNGLPSKMYMYGDEEPKDYLLERFESVETTCVPQSGHFMMLDRPAIFYDAIQRFIEQR